ncbi:MAG: anthranilate phosphoribosyltransferase [Pyrinomonadaceae bacterium]|nr:anthranilate phosphoribosyltransferase [Pyrinomonadaceae bacterium]
MSDKTDWLKSASLTRLSENSLAATPFRDSLWRLMRGESLSQTEAADFLRISIDRENANSEQIAGALIALAVKGETAEELAGMATVMRERSAPFETRNKNFIDIGGTGSSATKTFNVSTAAAFVIAGAGLPVAKYARRRVISNTGSIEVLEQLGVRLNYKNDDGGEVKTRETAQASFNGAGIGFLSALAYQNGVNSIFEIHRRLGVRTSFNLLGTLANPARPPFQIVGVWHKSLLEPMANALNLLGVKRAWIVLGADGLDEITLSRETFVAEVSNGSVNTFTIEPEDFGFQRASIEKLKVKNAAESAQIIKDVLASKRRDEARSMVILNAAAAIYVGGLAKTEIQAARLAEQSIDSDSARIKLERLIMTTNK